MNRHTLASAFAPLIVLCAMLVCGCANGAKTAEIAHAASFAAVDGFLKFEEENREDLSPKITAMADDLRAAAPPFFNAWHSAIQIYKSHPTDTTEQRMLKMIELGAEIMRLAVKAMSGQEQDVEPLPEELLNYGGPSNGGDDGGDDPQGVGGGGGDGAEDGLSDAERRGHDPGAG